MNETLFQIDLENLPLLHRGKVRDIFNIDERHLLIVTTDRLSAFDVILPSPIPGKGHILTQVSNFWFNRLEHIIPNHLASPSLDEIVSNRRERDLIRKRAIIVRRCHPLPIEAIVRGYLLGSGWKDYQQTGRICGALLPAGLRLAEALPEPIFTPSTKASPGAHDKNIDFGQAEQLLGTETARQIRDISLRLYHEAASYAKSRGIIIADTKFEFGIDPESGEIVLIDEALTPDSSRFWISEDYHPGTNPPSFDKQFVRDYLETLNWNKIPPGPRLPASIIEQTTNRYQEAAERLGVEIE